MATKRRAVNGDICLYGTSRTGAGFIVCRLDHGQTSGSGQPVAGRSFTEAVFMGVEHLRALGVERGSVRIFEPSGERMSIVDIGDVPAFGDLTWQSAPQYVISAADLLAKAEKPS